MTQDSELYRKILQHRGHKLVAVGYGSYADPVNAAIECETCYEVIISEDAVPIAEPATPEHEISAFLAAMQRGRARH